MIWRGWRVGKVIRELVRKHRLTVISFGISAALIMSGWIWAWVYLRRVEQPIILHFSSLSGIDLVGRAEELVAPAVLGMTVVGINFVLAMTLEERDWFLGKLLAGTTLAFAVLIFIGFAAIISVN